MILRKAVGVEEKNPFACCWCDEEEEEVPIADKMLVVLFGFVLLLSRCGGMTEQV